MRRCSEHLSSHGNARYVVLNKVDTLADPLATAGEVAAQIDSQRESTARTLGVEPHRVFPMSARTALAARVAGEPGAEFAGGLRALEVALQSDLLPRRRQLLEAAVAADTREVEQQAERRIADRRRQLAEQMLELRGLRGKSTAKVRLMLKRVDDETTDFERCTSRLQALRMVHSRMLKETLSPLSAERLRLEFSKFQADLKSSLFNLGGKRAFAAMCDRLREKVRQTAGRAGELRTMLEGSFAKLNAEYGFALALADSPDVERAAGELDLIERSYAQYLGLSQAVRLSNAAFMEQFRRMLLSKVGAIFETTCGELETWSRAASAQVEAQLRERRTVFRRRRESLERIQSAASELDARLAELEGHDHHLGVLAAQLSQHCDRLRHQAHLAPAVAEPQRLSPAA